MTQNRTCENCGTGDLIRFEVPNQTVLWRCPSCDLYQYGTPPSEEAYEEDYHEDYRQALTRKIRTAHVRLCRVSSVLDCNKPSMLDIGCSIGATVAAAKRRGWDAHGVDISRTAVEFCRREGLDCRQYDGQTLPYEDQTFDVITSWHVIEHVTSVSDTLNDWFRVLKPGGVMILETPDANCWKARVMGARYRKFWPAEHLYTFKPNNLAPFVERAGFEVLPSPLIVPPKNVGMTTSVYAVAHQSYLAVSRLSGFSKAFQIVARRPKNS
ncbi:MAG: methyltransferase domain-containing protein [Planctomycetota bacterium]